MWTFDNISLVSVLSCEPSPESHIRIIEVLVTSEWSSNQAAPGKVWFLSACSGTLLNVIAADCSGFNTMLNEDTS